MRYFSIIILIFTLEINNACSSAKKTVAPKENLSKIQTLVFLTPHLHIESVVKDSSSIDETLTARLGEKATQLIYQTLKGKYTIKNEPYFLHEKDKAAFRVFYTELDTLKKSLKELRIPEALVNEEATESNRYILATYISGFYNADYPPNYAYKQGSSDSGLKLALRPILSGLNIRLIVADRKTREVLLYSTNQSYSLDPRLSPEVERMLKTLIRPIYYK